MLFIKKDSSTPPSRATHSLLDPMATPPSRATPVTSGSEEQVTQPLDVRFEGLSSFKMNINKVVWTNEMLKNRNVINLDVWNNVGNNEERIEIIKEALSSLTVQVSVRSVGALMVCAWGLVSCGNPNESVFDGLWESSKGRELEDYKRLPYQILQSSRSRATDRDWIKVTTGNTLNWMRTACFYCAAVLRLVTKDHVALVKAWSGLSEHYQSFYRAPLEFNISLDSDCLECVRRVFQNKTMIRDSVAPFLLAFQELTNNGNRGLCEMLFEIHLRYTGLHAYTLFISNATRLAVPYDVFQGVLLRHRASKDALETIMEILKSYENPSLDEGDRKSKCTWVYSRIFDSDMFADLQTKRCTFLAALLAVIADTLGTSGGSGQATKIKQLEGYINQNQDNLHLWTGRIIEFCNKFNAKEETK